MNNLKFIKITSMKKYFLLNIFFLFIIHFILFITNCHSQWIPQSIPVNKPIIGIDFANENTGWAITENTSLTDTAYILGTTNGGTNWYVQFKGNIGLQSMDAINENICYAGGVDANGDALFIKTSNGGLNWTANNIGANKVADDMFFLNKDTGYICDNFSGGVYLTTDGGINWLNRQIGITVFPRTLFFINYETGYCGGGFKLFKTTNSGINWNQIFSFASFGNRDVLSVQFINDKGWAGLTNGGIAITTNEGTNWSLIKPDSNENNEMIGLSFVNDSVGWVGPDISQYIYNSRNGGYHWLKQITHIWGSRSISCKDTLTGWTCYLGISKTTNGGLTFVSGINLELPSSFKLEQNFPNPFNPSTKIRFTLIKNSEVSIAIYDILGREIFKYNSENILQPGVYEYNFSGENLSGGVYIYKLTAKSESGNIYYSDSKKMILLK